MWLAHWRTVALLANTWRRVKCPNLETNSEKKEGCFLPCWSAKTVFTKTFIWFHTPLRGWILLTFPLLFSSTSSSLKKKKANKQIDEQKKQQKYERSRGHNVTQAWLPLTGRGVFISSGSVYTPKMLIWIIRDRQWVFCYNCNFSYHTHICIHSGVISTAAAQPVLQLLHMHANRRFNIRIFFCLKTMLWDSLSFKVFF